MDKVKFLDPVKLRSIFDQMTEIEADPNSKKAQNYFNSLVEFERTNTKKRSSQILIKTMKRTGGRNTVNRIEVDQNGQPLSADEALFRKKNVDFTKYTWPEVNKINY